MSGRPESGSTSKKNLVFIIAFYLNTSFSIINLQIIMSKNLLL